MNRRPTTQDISWFLDLNRNKQLNLNPPYQRRSVWTRKDRTFFLDTIFRDYPCPAIYLYKATKDDGETVYHVVDGKQRLETIIAFANNEITIAKDFGDTHLDGKKWRDLQTSSDLQNIFWDYVLTVEMVSTVEGTVLNSVFDRLNRNSRRLERQELRHAKYEGWLITLAEKESEKEEWKRLKVVTTGNAKRMKDVQFLSELLLILLEEMIVGFDQDHLDNKYAEYEDLSQLDSNVSDEDIIEGLERTKSYLIEMENHNQCISTYAKTFGHFYTLWGIVTLEFDKLSDASTFSENYASFMEAVNEITNQEDLQSFFDESTYDPERYKYPLQYFQNAVGAITDLSQRQGRLDALIEGLMQRK